MACPGFPRVRIDITQHEPVIDTVAERTVFHPYPDELPGAGAVATYSFDELLAEKTRALYERVRPRDLYDVVYLFNNRPEPIDLEHVRSLFEKKCHAKELSVPSAHSLIRAIHADEELRSEWSNMLAHQLPALPDLDHLVQRLPDLLAWIDQPEFVLPERRLESAPFSATETPLASPGIRFWGGGLSLEAIRFAGANRLLIKFDYDGKPRVAEPYSLRRASTGNILLYAWEQASTQIKAFNVAKIENLRPTPRAFTPRYRVEFAQGTIPATPAARGRAATGWAPSPTAHRARRSVRTYVFQCPNCSKQFRRATNDPNLRSHKTKDSNIVCPGRRGFLVSMR